MVYGEPAPGSCPARTRVLVLQAPHQTRDPLGYPQSDIAPPAKGINPVPGKSRMNNPQIVTGGLCAQHEILKGFEGVPCKHIQVGPAGADQGLP